MDKLSLLGTSASVLCLGGIVYLALGQARLGERLAGLEASVAALEGGASGPAGVQGPAPRTELSAARRSRTSSGSTGELGGSEGTTRSGPSRGGETADDMAASAVESVDEELGLDDEEREALEALITQHLKERGQLQSRMRTEELDPSEVDEMRKLFQEDVIALVGEEGLRLVQKELMGGRGGGEVRRPGDGPPPASGSAEQPAPPAGGAAR